MYLLSSLAHCTTRTNTGTSVTGVGIMLALIQVYYTKTASPKKYIRLLKEMTEWDVRVFAWYFTVLLKLEQFHVEPINADSVQQIDNAMKTNLFSILPNKEALSNSTYDVYVTLCCDRYLCVFLLYMFSHDNIFLGVMLHNIQD